MFVLDADAGFFKTAEHGDSLPRWWTRKRLERRTGSAPDARSVRLVEAQAGGRRAMFCAALLLYGVRPGQLTGTVAPRHGPERCHLRHGAAGS